MIDWAHIGKSKVHETAQTILEYMDHPDFQKASPVQISRDLDLPLGNVSYHMKALHERGFLKKAGRRQVRGATEHFYRLSPEVKTR